MRLIVWLGLALLAVGCLGAQVHSDEEKPPDGGSAAEEPPSSTDPGGGAKAPGAGSITDERASTDSGDEREDGCRKLALLDAPGAPDGLDNWIEPDSSVPNTPLELETVYDSGIAVVTLRGPQNLLDKITTCQSHPFGGFGYRVDWDDGTLGPALSPADCSTDLRHEFQIGGTFEVRAVTFHPGGTDAPVFDSNHRTQLSFNLARLASKVRPLDLSIVGEKRDFRYQSGPNLKYVVHKNRPVYLCVELRGETGVISHSKLMRIRNHVTGGLGTYQYFSFGEQYKAALRAGETEFCARGLLFDESKQFLEQAASKPFRTTQLHSEELHTATFATDELHVTMEVPTFGPGCVQLDIDWGDRTDHTQRLLESIPDDCGADSPRLSFSHTYSAPGTYEVVLHSTEFDQWTPLQDTVGYWSYTVTVDARVP